MWGILVWWYTEGWQQCLLRVKGRFEATLDYFSITLLLRTLFAPFRQISASSVGGPLALQLQAFFDRLISRCIGATVRLFMIVAGGIVIIFNVTFGAIILLFWALVPFLPFIGFVMYMSGWLPWSN